MEVLDPAGGAIEGFGRDESKRYAGVDELRLRPGWKRFPDLKRLARQGGATQVHPEAGEVVRFSNSKRWKKAIHEGTRRTTKGHEEKLKGK